MFLIILKRSVFYFVATSNKPKEIIKSQNLYGIRKGIIIQPSSMVTMRRTIKIATSFRVDLVLLSIAILKYFTVNI